MAAVNLNTVRAIIEERLTEEFTDGPFVPLVFNNVPFDASNVDQYIQCITSFDRVVISGTEYKIIQINVLEQNNTAISYDLFLR